MERRETRNEPIINRKLAVVFFHVILHCKCYHLILVVSRCFVSFGAVSNQTRMKRASLHSITFVLLN